MSRLGISADARILRAPQGMTSEVAFVDDHGRQSVLKRCRDSRYVQWLQREHRVLHALAVTSLPVPRVLGYDERHDQGRVAEAALLMTRLPGEPLWNVLLQCGAAERRRRLRAVGELLRRLHSTPPPEALRSATPWIDRMLDQAETHLAWADGSAELLAHLRATRPAPDREVLIHGDLALDNVLVAPDGTLSLIDWPFGDTGDRRYDIALALDTEPDVALDEGDLTAFFDAYGDAPNDAATLQWFRDLYEFF